MIKFIHQMFSAGYGEKVDVKPTRLLRSIDISIAIVSMLLVGMLVKVLF